MAKFGRVHAKRLVLDIGSSAIRLCELKSTQTGYELTKYRQREAPIEPTMDDEARHQVLGETLKALLKEAKVRTRKTVFGVPGRSVFTRPRTLPLVPEFKVTQIVQYEIQQQIPFSLDQIALDYQILNRLEGTGYDILMAAIKAEVVDKHIEIFAGTKCDITVVDVSPLAAYNWVKRLGEFGTQGECVALLDLGASTTDIVIERQNQFRFTRPLNVGGNDVTKALHNAFGLSFSDAEKFKRQRGFAPTGDPQRDGKVGEVIGQVLNRMVTEINRSFAYFRSQPGGGVVDRVILTGGGACLRNLVPYLQQRLGVDVRIVQPLAGLTIGPDAQEANQHPEQACVALGMALRCCETVPIELNLIPPRVLEAARLREQIFYWILSIATMGLIAASIIPARVHKDRAIQERITMYEQYLMHYDAQLAQTPGSPSVYLDQLGKVERDISTRVEDLTTLNKAYADAFFALDLLKEVNDLRPAGGKIWLSSFETIRIASSGSSHSGAGRLQKGFGGISPMSEDKVKAPPRPNGIRLIGYASDPESVREYIQRLKESDTFKPGVHFLENSVERVPITELDNARVSSTGTRTVNRRGTRDGRSRRSDTGRRSTPGAVSGMPVETVVFFSVDLQFAK